MVSLRSVLLLLAALAMCFALAAASTADGDALVDFDGLVELEAAVEMGVDAEMESEMEAEAETEAESESESLAPGEGASCTRSGVKGTCTAAACTGGTKFTGLCPGAANIQCCIKTVTKKTTAATTTTTTPAKTTVTPIKTTAPAKVSSPSPTASAATSSTGGKLTTTSIPYKFPYATGRYIVADIAKQRIRVYDGTKGVMEWKISSGANGVGFKSGSHASPVGKFKIIGKYGDGAPLGMRFESLRAIGKIGYPTDKKAHVQTRVLQIGGLDPENKNTASRAIYIHGTNAEMQLGWKGSHGCFRMSNRGVVQLFDMVQTGTLFFVAPKNAWP